MTGAPYEPFAESRRLKLWVEIILCCHLARPLPPDERLMAMMHDGSVADLERAFVELRAEHSIGIQSDSVNGTRSVRMKAHDGGFTAWTPWPARQPARAGHGSLPAAVPVEAE